MCEKTEEEFQNQEVRIFSESEIVKYERVNTPILDTINNRSNTKNGINYYTGAEPTPNIYVGAAHDNDKVLSILKTPDMDELTPLDRMGMTWNESTTLLEVLAQVKEGYYLVDNAL